MRDVIRHIEEVSQPDVLSAQVSYRIRLLQIAAYKSFERIVTGFGTAPRYYGLLKIVEANPGISQTRLAEAIYLDRSSLVSILSTLTDQGWIERKPTHKDRRVRRVFLAPDGAARLSLLDIEAARHEAIMTQGLSEAERAMLLHLLDRLDDNLRTSLAQSVEKDAAR